MSPRTIAELVSHCREEELTEDSTKSFSTRKAHSICLHYWIVPAWALHLLSDARTIAVEDWLDGLTSSNGSKAKIRNLPSALFNHAIRHEWIERNPIRLARQSAKRERAPEVLTAEEIKALLSQLDRPYYVIAFLAAVAGLRVSELRALKWRTWTSPQGRCI
jgi:integrase